MLDTPHSHGFVFCFLFFVFLPLSLFAQDKQNKQSKQTSTPYQIPATIYVGDEGKLVYPLSQFSYITKDTKVTVEEITDDTNLDSNSELFLDVVIRNVELDREAKNLIVDFKAYRTGKIKLPAIIIGSEKLDALEVQIASLLDSGNSTMALSEPAIPLAAQGTFWIITSIVLLAIVFLLILYLFWKKGSFFLSFLNSNVRSYFLLQAIFNTIKKIQKMLAKENIMPLAAISSLTYELRKFFSSLWNTQCMSMVPEEFLTVENEVNKELYDFFKLCDSIRFSGETISQESVAQIISNAKNILNNIKDSTKRKNTK